MATPTPEKTTGKAKAKPKPPLASSSMHKNMQTVIAWPMYESIVTGGGMREEARYLKLENMYHATGANQVDYTKECLAAHGAYTRLWERMNSGTAETLILSQFLNENQVLVSGQSFTVDSLKLASLKSKAKVKGKTIYRRINLALADAKKLMAELEKLLGPDGKPKSGTNRIEDIYPAILSAYRSPKSGDAEGADGRDGEEDEAADWGGDDDESDDGSESGTPLALWLIHLFWPGADEKYQSPLLCRMPAKPQKPLKDQGIGGVKSASSSSSSSLTSPPSPKKITQYQEAALASDSRQRELGGLQSQMVSLSTRLKSKQSTVQSSLEAMKYFPPNSPDWEVENGNRKRAAAEQLDLEAKMAQLQEEINQFVEAERALKRSRTDDQAP